MNLTGYLFAVVLEYLLNLHLYCFVASLSTLAISGVVFTLAMTDDIHNNFTLIKNMLEIKGTRLEMYTKFRHCIEMHSNIKRLSEIVSHFSNTFYNSSH